MNSAELGYGSNHSSCMAFKSTSKGYTKEILGTLIGLTQVPLLAIALGVGDATLFTQTRA